MSWMLYSIAVGAILAGGALALDKVAEIWNARRRGIWIAGVAAAIALPPMALVAPRVVPATPASAPHARAADGVERENFRVVSGGGTPTLAARLRTFFRPVVSSATSSAVLNRDAQRVWLSCSLLLLTVLVFGALRLRRLRARWTAAVVDGHDVSISRDVGPAVVGTLNPRIVVPSWALSLDADQRALMLRHEAEHVRGRDPLVLAFAALAVTAFPWNPFVWLLVRRLRLAVEIDCDARVLACDARADDYGSLLLTVGARAGGALRFTASLAEPRSFLERRIIAMTMHRSAHPFAASLPFIAIFAVAAAAAAQTPRPARAPEPASAPVVAPAVAAPMAASAPTAAPVAAPASVARASVPAPSVAPAAGVARSGPAAAPVSAAAPVGGVASARPAPAASPARAEIPVEVLREWIQQYHPNVIAGDASVNQVVIVVDANEQYLRSYARFDSTPGMNAGGMRGRVGGGGRMAAAGVGRIGRGPGSVGDTTVIEFNALAASLPSDRPLVIVDGVVVNGVDGIERDRIHSVEVIKGAAAIAKYGPAANRGVIVIDTKSENMLSTMNIDAEQIQSIDIMKLPPGTIGPNQLRVLVVQLKPGDSDAPHFNFGRIF